MKLVCSLIFFGLTLPLCIDAKITPQHRPTKKSMLGERCTIAAAEKAEHSFAHQAEKACDAQWGVSKRLARWSHIADEIEHKSNKTVQQIPITPEKKDFMVRVLLDEQALGAVDCAWHLSCAAGFCIYDRSKPSRSRCIKKSDLYVTCKKGEFYINDRQLHMSSFCVEALQGYITKDDCTYEGDFIFTLDKKRALCMNSLDLESYVCSVLKSESWPGWPLEVNKAFAIMARTYAMAQARTAHKNKRLYHIKNTNAHQTYRGVHSLEMIKQAVKETEGVIIAYDNEPILAMFDACCGGVTPMHIENGINFIKAPYLARSYPCTHCKSCKIFRWKAEYDLPVFEGHLCSELHTAARLHDVTITKKDKAGLVVEISLKQNTVVKKLSGRRLYSLLSDVKSYCFDIRRKGKKIIIEGNGFGHHLGLCQWGAREMVRHGYSHQRILAFYYPKTNLMRIDFTA
jgi:stage II sporulation protein D (peptidoglycan lytic transglycosylase)